MSTRTKPVAVRDRLAATLRRERKRRGWTQQVAGNAAGLDVRHWRKLEAAEVNFTARTLERLCQALDIDVRDLFEMP